MGIDPASPRCDRFYAALARLDVPLVTHGGLERAVISGYSQDLGNPLRLRRALAAGVRVIVAHCASMGTDRDLDRGADGPLVPSFDLFARLMEDARYDGRLYGDISAMPQVNRAAPALARVVERTDWHPRLLNGSDYPLPGVMPLFSVDYLVSLGLLTERAAPTLKAIRAHNPLLFDFVAKRHLRSGGKSLARSVFETRGFFERAV
jgi:mannonate dehydratase